MKQTTKNFFRLFPTYLLSFLLCAAAFIAGYFTKGNFTTAGIAVFAASLFIIAFLTITGKIYGFYHAKKVGSEDPLEKEDNRYELAKNIKAAPKKYMSLLSLYRAYTIAAATICLMALLAVMFGFSCMMAWWKYTIYCVPIVAAYCPLPAYFMFFLFGIAHEEDQETFVNQKNFPVISKAVTDIAKSEGIKGDVRIAFTNEFELNVKTDKGADIIIGVPLLMSLTEEEFLRYVRFNIVFDSLPKVKKIEKSGEIFASWETYRRDMALKFSVPSPTVRFVCAAIEYGQIKHMLLYDAMKTALVPSFLTDAAERCGGQEVANAFAKEFMYEVFDYKFSQYMDEPFYRPSEPRSDVCSCATNVFLKNLRSDPDKWINAALRVATSVSGNAPSVRDFMRACKVDRITLDFQQKSGDFYEETVRVENNINESARLFYKHMTNYEASRQALYIQPTQTVEKFEMSGGLNNPDNSALTPVALRPVAEAYNEIMRSGDAVKICDYVLSSCSDDGKCDYALYIKGKYLLFSDDEAGIDLVERAMKQNGNYVFDGTELITEFWRLRGNTEKAEEARNNLHELVKKTATRSMEMKTIAPGDAIAPAKVDDAVVAQLIALVEKSGNGLVSAVYAVEKTDKNHSPCVYVILDYDKNTDAVQRHEISREVFFYLDSLEEQYSLFDLDDFRAGVRKKISAMRGAKIYSPED